MVWHCDIGLVVRLDPERERERDKKSRSSDEPSIRYGKPKLDSSKSKHRKQREIRENNSNIDETKGIKSRKGIV